MDEGVMRDSKRRSLQAVELSQRIQTAVCRNLPPPEMGTRVTVFGQAGHADPLHGWLCSSLKRVMRDKSWSDNITQTSLDLRYLL